MAFLIDTHTLIWFLDGNERLPQNVNAFLRTTHEDVFVSIATLWEVSIKHSMGKLSLNGTLAAYFDLVSATGFSELAITQRHLLAMAKLPYHHKDPFDRLLIAQSIADDITLISGDSEVKAYPVKLLW